MLKQDYHIHSNFSDGYEPPETMIQSAIDKEVDQICITDHYSMFKPALKPGDLDHYFHTLQELKDSYSDQVQVFIGIEIDVTSIEPLGFDHLKDYSWDLVLFEYVFGVPDWEQVFREVLRYKKRFPDSNVGLAHTRFSRVTQSKLDSVLSKLNKYRIIIELNSHYQNYLDPWFQYLDDQNLFSVGSDAHSSVQLGEVDGALSFLQHRNIPFHRIIDLSKL